MTRRCNHPLRVVLASGALAMAFGTHVQAADEGGIGGLFRHLFSPPAQPAPQVSPAPESNTASPDRLYAYRRARRSESATLRPKARYAALHQAEPLKVRVTNRQTPLDMSQGPTAALLKDDTLRPGDIVVMPGGARVFAGDAGKQHRMRDFERLDQSPLVDRKTRNLLAAMMVPIGAMPAYEARRIMARAKIYRLPETSSVQGASMQASSMQASAPTLRIVYPGVTGP